MFKRWIRQVDSWHWNELEVVRKLVQATLHSHPHLLRNKYPTALDIGEMDFFVEETCDDEVGSCSGLPKRMR